MSQCPNPFRYTTADSVKVRLYSKVQFQRGGRAAPEEVSNELLKQIIEDAESDVELALSPRYAIPFQRISMGDFDDLPDTTKRQIRKVVDLRAVKLLLDTDFGRQTVVEGEVYTSSAKSQYEDAIALLLGKEKVGTTDVVRARMTPPLPELRLSPTNRADTGMFGKIINTDRNENALSNYAAEQVNDPSRRALPFKIIGGPL